MKLTLKDRITILNILPAQGDFTTMIAKSDLVEKIKITQDEIAELKIVNNDGGGISWNGDKDSGKEFDITELENSMVKEALKKLDEEKKLSDDTVIIYKKFNQ